MVKVIFGIFFVLHGFVYLLYAGHSFRFFELQPGMLWPNGSWTLSKLLGDNAVRTIAGITLILAATGFILGGFALFTNQIWWKSLTVNSAVFSSVVLILFWDGGMDRLGDKGGIGILINLAILAVLLIFKWPAIK